MEIISKEAGEIQRLVVDANGEETEHTQGTTWEDVREESREGRGKGRRRSLSTMGVKEQYKCRRQKV